MLVPRLGTSNSSADCQPMFLALKLATFLCSGWKGCCRLRKGFLSICWWLITWKWVQIVRKWNHQFLGWLQAPDSGVHLLTACDNEMVVRRLLLGSSECCGLGEFNAPSCLILTCWLLYFQKAWNGRHCWISHPSIDNQQEQHHKSHQIQLHVQDCHIGLHW
jgi:hypothetical protein